MRSFLHYTLTVVIKGIWMLHLSNCLRAGLCLQEDAFQRVRLMFTAPARRMSIAGKRGRANIRRFFVFTCVSTTSAAHGVANACVRVLRDLLALPLLLRKTAISCCRHEMMLSRNFTCARQDAPRPSPSGAWSALGTGTHVPF